MKKFPILTISQGSRRGRQEQEARKEGKEEEQSEESCLQRIFREGKREEGTEGRGAQRKESCTKDESANERLEQGEVNKISIGVTVIKCITFYIASAVKFYSLTHT